MFFLYYNLVMKKNSLFIILIFAFIWSILVYFNILDSIDIWIYSLIRLIRNSYLTSIFKFITFFAGVKYTIILCILSFIIYYYKGDKRCLNLIILVILCTLINLIIKNIIGRERPDIAYRLVSESGFSFPSGHSMISTVIYGYLISIIDNKWCKYLLVLLILLIGFSRIYLGVHYFSDIIGGYLYGIIVLILGNKFLIERGNNL